MSLRTMVTINFGPEVRPTNSADSAHVKRKIPKTAVSALRSFKYSTFTRNRVDETRVSAKDLRRRQYVSIFISFHAIIFRSHTLSVSQTGVKTEFNAK